MEFYQRHVCRADPWPDDVVRSFDAMESRPDGLRDHERADGVHRRGDDQATSTSPIACARSRCPVLLVSGEHDEVRPHLTAAMHERLRHGERVVFEDSSHMPHIEEPERFLAVVRGVPGAVEA